MDSMRATGFSSIMKVRVEGRIFVTRKISRAAAEINSGPLIYYLYDRKRLILNDYPHLQS